MPSDIAAVSEEFVQLLLQHGANPNTQATARRMAPLHCAAETGNLGLIRLVQRTSFLTF
jgi:hypothetical protein